jgi:MFS family permease
MQIIAQGWVVYQIGHIGVDPGSSRLCLGHSVLVVSPWGGVVVDRVSRRKLLVLTQSGSMLLAFILAVLMFMDAVQEWHVVVLAALLGVVNAFDAPRVRHLSRRWSARRNLPNAIALNSMMFNSARVIGPAIAGLVLAAVGAAWCFTLNGISFFAVIVGLLLMKLPHVKRFQHIKLSLAAAEKRIEIHTGNREISSLILLSLGLSVFGISYQRSCQPLLKRLSTRAR